MSLSTVEFDQTESNFSAFEKEDEKVGVKRAKNRKSIEDIQMRRELEADGISPNEYHSIFE